MPANRSAASLSTKCPPQSALPRANLYRRPRESGGPEQPLHLAPWIPAFAGMTRKDERAGPFVGDRSGDDQHPRDPLLLLRGGAPYGAHRIAPDLSAAGLGRARPGGDLAGG